MRYEGGDRLSGPYLDPRAASSFEERRADPAVLAGWGRHRRPGDAIARLVATVPHAEEDAIGEAAEALGTDRRRGADVQAVAARHDSREGAAEPGDDVVPVAAVRIVQEYPADRLHDGPPGLPEVEEIDEDRDGIACVVLRPAKVA